VGDEGGFEEDVFSLKSPLTPTNTPKKSVIFWGPLFAKEGKQSRGERVLEFLNHVGWGGDYIFLKLL